MVAALEEAERFLAPALNRSTADKAIQGKSIIDVLSDRHRVETQASDDEQDAQRRRDVISKALSNIRDLHALCGDSSHGVAQQEAVANQRSQKIIHALLDITVLEGIYPSLSSGVGVPVERRLKSALKGFTTRSLSAASGGKPGDRQLLTDIVECLSPISFSRIGLSMSVQDRTSVDLLAATGELAFSPAFNLPTRQHFASTFKGLIDSKSALDLFPQLTSLLHPSCPEWFRSAVSSYLSVLPLRPDGVRQTINFIAGSSSVEQSLPDGQSDKPAGPNVSLEALARTSKLLTSVPSTMNPDQWASALAPQLLDLLDDPSTDNRRIASYIIGTGFLSKRRLGSPGTVGWRLFAEPIITSLNPPSERCPVSDGDLKLAFDRLSVLVHFHSNPGLTKRLVSPLLLPLWGLLCYALENRRSTRVDQVHQILGTYMKISATDSQLLLLSDNVLWDGSKSWTFMPGASGGIEIRLRDDEGSNSFDMVKMLDSIDNRVGQYLTLLRAAVATDDQLGKIFTHVSRCWLLGHRTSGYERLGDDVRSPVESLVYAKITQKLLEEYKDKVASSFEGMLQLVDPILSAFVAASQRTIKRRDKNLQPSLDTLSDIVHGVGEAEDDGQDAEATASTALGLLSTVLASSDESLGNIETGVLDRVQDSLRYVAQAAGQENSLNMTASNVLMLLQLHRDTPGALGTEKNTANVDILADDRNHHRKALRFVGDELAPVRAQGLSILTSLASKASPILDVPSTVILLISLLQDEDEYIYLSAIKTLGLLASNHPKTVVKALIEKYADPYEESSLDVRMRVGEALNKTVEHLRELLVEDTARTIGESMVAVASRRGERPKTLQKKERAKRKAEKTRKEAEDAWDGDIPGEGEELDDDDNEGKMNAHIAKVVEGWADTGREEDVRLRASALSILGTAIETNIAGVGASITSTAVDCVLAILKLERSVERAILRRAAVMVIMSVVRAIDAAEEGGQQLGFGFAGENLVEVVTVLRYVEVTDGDEVVVGHVRAVIESLEAWRQKALLGSGRRMREGEKMGISLDGLLGEGTEGRGRIEELE
ncbi:MAG: hypothetical protein Q9207_000205 [Kuettlingeria erythrocarpa]